MEKKGSNFQELLLKRTSIMAAGVMLFLTVLSVPNAHAWWDGKWQQRQQIQFDASAQGADIKDNLTDVPMLVRLHTGNFSFSGAKDDGSDLRFVSADDKTPLKHHIEKYDPKEEIALVWVKVPMIMGGNQQNAIWMYFGNSSTPDGQDAGGTYDVNQIAVYHFGELHGNPNDSTAYANHTTTYSGKPGIPSVSGNGYQFSGTDTKLTIARSTSFNFAKGFTWSGWVRLGKAEGNSQLFSWDDGSQSIIVGIDEGKAYASLGLGKVRTTETPKTTALTPNSWHHLAVTAEPDKQIIVYLDGRQTVMTPLKGAVPAPSAELVIGASSKGDHAFIGDLDEMQFSNIARPAGWIKAAFQGQGPDGTLISFLEPEAGGGGGEPLTIHLMKVIIKTITLDGWLIIGICVIMGFLSLYIFRQKLLLLKDAKKGNETFNGMFKDVDHPFALLDKHEQFTGSSIYRVYHAGTEELKQWFARKGTSFEPGSGISDRALNGFKAALEKTAMYESRKMSAGMVVMHMSIAGGPFLGLLGTVWGVMNTFAGLAESGEANLSAIAPGVASALACTMAGLLVAIPSLFANSYLTGHIKNMNADVNVFIDDFILKLEEHKEAAS